MTSGPVTMPDLVCGTEGYASSAAVMWDDADERYYFCSADCRRAFVDQRGVDVRRSHSA